MFVIYCFLHVLYSQNNKTAEMLQIVKCFRVVLLLQTMEN
jgi:hypothetical protein